MLPERLLDVGFEGGELVPRYLTGRDHHWVEAALDLFAAGCGCTRAVVEERLAESPRLGERWLAWQALTHLLLGMHRFEVDACLAPRQIREELFVEAARSGAVKARELVAQRFGVPIVALERDLYADVAAARVMRPPARMPSTAELIERYNLSLVQGLLLRSEALSVRLEGQLKAVLRWARLKRLLCSVDAGPGGACRLQVSGPLSLFHHTLVYGRAMAAWVPALTRAPRWQLQASCLFRGRRFMVSAGHLDPIGSSHAPPRRFDSQLEERLFRDLRRVAPGWEVLREAEVVQVGRRLLSPDFTLVDGARGLRVPVEVVGFWTPEYLRSKLAALSKLPSSSRWIICLDETLAAAGNGPLPEGRIFRFRRRIEVRDFLSFVEDWLARERNGARDEPA